jgi:hypothetical protein
MELWALIVIGVCDASAVATTDSARESLTPTRNAHYYYWTKETPTPKTKTKPSKN